MTTATQSMKFSEFIDFLLIQLYELEKERGAGRYFSLNAIAKELKEEVPVAWIRDAGKVLESRLLANCAFMIGGNVQAQLSGEGRLWVEEGKGSVPRITEEMKKLVTVNVTGSNNQVVVAGGDQSGTTQTLTIEQEREPAFKLIEEMEKELDRDTSLGEQERRDARTDLSQVKDQLKKREPNRPALAALLEPLSQFTSIATRVVELIKLINP
jgi:hypothetical protein